MIFPDKVSDFLSGSKALSPCQPEEDKSILSADIIETGWLYKKKKKKLYTNFISINMNIFMFKDL